MMNELRLLDAEPCFGCVVNRLNQGETVTVEPSFTRSAARLLPLYRRTCHTCRRHSLLDPSREEALMIMFPSSRRHGSIARVLLFAWSCPVRSDDSLDFHFDAPCIQCCVSACTPHPTEGSPFGAFHARSLYAIALSSLSVHLLRL